MRIRQEAVQRNLPETRIYSVTFPVLESTLFSLDQDVDALYRVHRREVEAFYDFQHLQMGESGGIRRGLGHPEATVDDLDGVLNLVPAFCQVVLIDQHAGLLHPGGQTPSELAAIEGIGAVGGDFLQRASEVGLHDRRRQRRFSLRLSSQEHRMAAAVGGNHPANILHEMAVMVGGGEAVPSMFDRRRAQPGPGKRAVGGVKGVDAGQEAGG